MTYDWGKTLTQPEGSVEFYREIDRRLCEALPEVHRPYSPYSLLLDREPLQGKRVLVIGCGAGVEVGVFQKRGAAVWALDFTERALALTRRRGTLFGFPLRLARADAESLPFREASFDVIWSWGVIHHVPDMEKTVQEIRRVLRPGGKALIMVYRRDSINFWVHLMFIRGILMGKLFTRTSQEICNLYSDGTLARYYSPQMIRKLFSEFQTVSFQGFSQLGGVYPLPRRMRRWVAACIPRCLTQYLKRRWGDFLYFEAVK